MGVVTGRLGLLQRVAARARATSDSSATPKAGRRRITPTRLAGYEVSGGTFGAYLSTLWRNGLADVTGEHVLANVRAAGG